MAATYTQSHRFMAVKTPLKADALLLTGLAGDEALSQPFHYRLDLIAESAEAIAFDKVLGQPVTVRVELPQKRHRYVNGICSRFAQGESDRTFTAYQMEVVPRLWLLTKIARSRIFQQKGVPDILREVLKGVGATFELQGTFKPRDYCVQYRETDFNFASRLMEEEGIYYFFRHSNGDHQMVVANTPQSHPDLPTDSRIVYKSVAQAVAHDADYIHEWNKAQELTAGKVTLWDHTFELPHKHLEAEKGIVDGVQVGQAAHKLKVGENGKLERYDYPGAYAQRFDGVSPGGGDRAADLQNIFQDNKRTAEIRMQQEAATAIVVRGGSNCRQLVAGHKFTLATLPGDSTAKPLQADGGYVLTAVSHAARVGSDYKAGDWSGFSYRNSFAALPAGLPYRPARGAPKPVVPGSQTAVVVGPPGEEIFTDKYGRVKVQFHWDRDGKYDADSSCWVRVATSWADKGFGFIQVPRIGQEVIVDFLEGDPDQPIITGCVFNAQCMPPFGLPDKRMISGYKSNSYPGGGGYNQFTMDDTKGKELIHVHGQYDMDTKIEHDERVNVGNNRTEQVGLDETITIGNNRTETVKNDEKVTVVNNRDKTIGVNHTEKIGSNKTITVGANHTESIGANMRLAVGSNKTETVAMASAETVGLAKALSVGGAYAVTVGAAMNTAVGGASFEEVGLTKKVIVGEKLELICGSSRIVLESGGKITIEGKEILMSASGPCKINGDPIDLN